MLPKREPIDVNGVEISVGDTVRHAIPPCEDGERSKAPGDMHLFFGTSKVTHICNSGVKVVRVNKHHIPYHAFWEIVKVT